LSSSASTISRSSKKNEEIRKNAGQKRLELFYLPTYSPDFNPDEGVWSHLKSQELKAHQATNKEELIKKTHEALKRMAKRPVLIRSFFKRKRRRLPDLKDLGNRINVENLDDRFRRTRPGRRLKGRQGK